MQKRSVYILLALLFGGIGVHKFYDDKIGMGLIYLLFCWTFIPGLVALVEAVQALCQSSEQFNLAHPG